MTDLERDILALFSPPTRLWFERTFGQPTPPQAGGWPAIQRGDHALILAPTGSGKTLAAFLWGIDQLYRELSDPGAAGGASGQPWLLSAPAGRKGSHGGLPSETHDLRLVYISPLKALNNDIHRNLRVPLGGIHATAEELGLPFPDIRIAVRSGDTPSKERQAMLRRAPHILITTPESFYLLLTSPRAREMFRGVRTVIVDEIHTLVGTKRGVHLSLSLERLAHLARGPVQRIGLSATVRPPEEAARFLGGGEVREDVPLPEPPDIVARPVTLADTHYRKPLDLRVITPVPDFRFLPGGSIWPALIPQVLDLIRQHRTTLIFCNNRRQAERTADRLNELIAAELEGRPSTLIKDGVASGLGTFATGTGTNKGPVRAHHGSVSREARLAMERDLKAGKLPALVATSSLELGIDIGAVDLVVQIQSPRGVAQGLQRVGRSGHLVGQTSVGRLFATYREEVVEIAAVAGGMLHGEVEPSYTPRNPLDVLAQQIVAMVSVEDWGVDDLYRLVRQAFAYHRLSWDAYLAVLDMLAGRYADRSRRELRARLVWDRVNNRLLALPGSRLAAVSGGGTIPDRGAYTAYLGDGKTRLGELDEEFVYETRVGDVFMLGSQAWRVLDITDDRVIVAESPGALSRMPFWHGDYPWRPYEVGRVVGQFRRAVAEKLALQSGAPGAAAPPESPDAGDSARDAVAGWLRREYALDESSAGQVMDYIASQIQTTGAISSDRTVVVEAFEDELGYPRWIVQSPFGGRVNGPWGLALASVLREQTGAEVEVQANDDGILLRFAPTAEEGTGVDRAASPQRVIAMLGPAEARERILRELPDSAVFGARFRQNAGRALLLPGRRPGKRTPFWLQRLRARDLLQAVRQYPDFPILVETYRDCLEDVMDLPHLEEVLRDIQSGRIEVVAVESVVPSPVALELTRQFTGTHMYEWDAPKAERQLQQLAVNRDLLQDVLKDVALDELLRPEAIQQVVAQLQRTSPDVRVRTPDELALLLEQVGDLTLAEIRDRAAADPTPWVKQLRDQARSVEVAVRVAEGSEWRWAHADYAEQYGEFRAVGPERARAWQGILDRYFDHAGPATERDILARYPFPADWLHRELERRLDAGELARGRFSPRAPAGEPGASLTRPEEAGASQYLHRRTLVQIHRQTIGLLRREVRPVPRPVYADFLARWQHLHPAGSLRSSPDSGRPSALVQALQQLRAVPAIGPVWERDILPLRLEDYHPAELESLCQGGELVWIGSGAGAPRRGRVRFLFRGEGSLYLAPPEVPVERLSAGAQAVYGALKAEGALFFADLAAALDVPPIRIEQALLELVMNEWVTNDSLQALRQLMLMDVREPDIGATSTDRRVSPQWLPSDHPDSPGQPTERRAGNPAWPPSDRAASPGGRPSRPGPAQYRAARRRVAERLQTSRGPASRSYLQVGRWSLVQRLGIMGRERPVEEKADLQARQLLQRWGIVTRTSLEAEEGAWHWQAIASQLALLEMRGEVRRGYFVAGLPGPQYALPDAVEQLRALREGPAVAEELADAPVVLNACDPASLYGPEMPDGPQAAAGQALAFARLPSTWWVQWRGWPVIVARGGGAGLVTVQGADEGLIVRALQALLAHLSHHRRHVTARTWNGQPVLESQGRSLLEALGFARDYPAMTWEP